MKLMWNGAWIEAPTYLKVPNARLIRVESTLSLAKTANPSGRVIPGPVSKTLRFAVTEGPRSTYRKARSKLTSRQLVDDYRLVAAVGRCTETGARYVCLGCRVPPCADFLAVNKELSREVPSEFSAERLERLGNSLADMAASLVDMSHETYLYSGRRPPPELAAALDRALCDTIRSTGRRPSSAATWIAPPGEATATTSMQVRPATRHSDRLPIAMLGGGDYARTHLALALRGSGVERTILCDREPQIAALAAREMGFQTASTDPKEAVELLERPGLVIIATYHDSHAELAAHALERGHRVFLEKPPVVSERDLQVLLAASSAAPGRLEVGFNRRYSRLMRRAQRVLAGEQGPLTVVCTIRELSIDPEHWYFWPNQGTRVAGNLCHWIDAAVFLMGAKPDPITVTVSPPVVDGLAGIDAERSFSVEFDDGSAACLLMTGRGDDVRGVQETIEARRGGVTVRLDDLWRMTTLRGGRASRRRTVWRDKGHRSMYREALGRVERGQSAAYSTRDLVVVSATQLAATEAARSGESRREVTLLPIG